MLRFTQDVYRDEAGEPRVRWRGHIRHVQGDNEARFTDFADVVGFIQRQLAQLTLESVAGDDAADQARALADSFRLWERFATDYADLVAKSVEQTVRQTEAYQRQVGSNIERTLAMWNPLLGAARPHPSANAATRAAPATEAGAPVAGAAADAVLAAIGDLRARVDAIAEQLARLERATGGEPEGGGA